MVAVGSLCVAFSNLLNDVSACRRMLSALVVVLKEDAVGVTSMHISLKKMRCNLFSTLTSRLWKLFTSTSSL